MDVAAYIDEELTSRTGSTEEYDSLAPEYPGPIDPGYRRQD
jgi:hypothetical protein